MRTRIFLAMWLLTIFVLTCSYGVTMYSLYSHFTTEQFQQLWNETQLASQGVSLAGLDYLETLDPVGYRITWITEEGEILFDNAANRQDMESHLAREEIQDALSLGKGQSSRYSSTLSSRQLYTAKRLKDGTVLRLSITQTTIWDLFFQFFWQMVLLLAGGMLLSLFIASRLSLRIVDPINNLNLDDPIGSAQDSTYAEIRPLLKRLDEQHRQLQQDKEELEKTSLIRQEFTANASHELKTPLHVISGYAELLESGMVEDEADRRTFAGKIRTESQRMTKLVEDIIDLSRLDGGGIGMQRGPCDVYRIAQNAVESLQSTAEEAGVSVSLSGESGVIEGVSHVLYSIVYNLTLNGITYTERGGSVEVSIRSEASRVVLRVSDTGIGIPAQDLDRIFERFYRVDKSHSKEVGGTGLGLSIVKHAARLHKATVEVTSTLGSGSVFTVLFPKGA